VSKRKGGGGDIAPPDDSLRNYFDDLLSDDLLGAKDLHEQAFAATDARAMPVAASSGGARIVSLPTKKSGEEQPKKPTLRVEPTLKSAPRPSAAFIEPEPLQTLEQKLKLEKLLHSARTQLMMETPVASQVTEQVTNQFTTQLTTQVSTEKKTEYVSDPAEIQEWVIEAPVVEAVPEEVQFQQATQRARYQIEGLEWLENGRPQWAQSRFEVLLFKVSGLTLAVPLISLGQIQPLTDELTPLFGQADWFMGLQPTPAGKICTVNTAKFVMPERYDERFLQTAKYVVSINGVPWGLAVDSVNQPIRLMPEDVKWRTDRSKRPWLAGTIK
jgi:purine-binding chemotaxis protein CheW